MFSFIKKDKEKDKDKKDKKKKEKDEKQDKKQVEKKERQNMTPEEITRIEEMKGMLRKLSDRDKNRSSQKSADHSSPGESEDAMDSASSSHSSPVKETRHLTKPQPLPRQQLLTANSRKDPPAVMPKPKVKSILKGKGDAGHSLSTSVNLDDTKLLQENTKRNEDMFVQQSSSSNLAASPSLPTQAATPSSSQGTPSTPAEEEDSKPKPFESKLKLPPIIPPKPPRIREVEVQRMQSGGFGFSLRKGLIPEPGGGPSQVVTFAEPGSGSSSIQTGLLPGDKLIEINGQNVENMSREEIVEIIKNSSDKMILKVQPIQELIELSIRPNRDGTTTDIQEDAAKSGTLRRSGSLRYKQGESEELQGQSTIKFTVVQIEVSTMESTKTHIV